MTTTPLRSSAASSEPDRLSIRISNLRTRQKALDAEQAELDAERREIARLQREALGDEPQCAAAADDARPARQRPAAENDADVVTDGVVDPVGFAASALRAARLARGEKV